MMPHALRVCAARAGPAASAASKYGPRGTPCVVLRMHTRRIGDEHTPMTNSNAPACITLALILRRRRFDPR